MVRSSLRQGVPLAFSFSGLMKLGGDSPPPKLFSCCPDLSEEDLVSMVRRGLKGHWVQIGAMSLPEGGGVSIFSGWDHGRTDSLFIPSAGDLRAKRNARRHANKQKQSTSARIAKNERRKDDIKMKVRRQDGGTTLSVGCNFQCKT